MNKPLIWIASAVAGIGVAIPAYAAMSSHSNGPVTTPISTVVSTPEPNDDTTTVPSTPTSATSPQATAPSGAPMITTATSVEDISGPCDEPEHATDDRCTGADAPDVTANTTATGVEDISGPCDEAEHATDDRCTGVDTDNGAGADDNSGRDSSGSGHDGNDDADHGGHGGGNDD